MTKPLTAVVIFLWMTGLEAHLGQLFGSQSLEWYYFSNNYLKQLPCLEIGYV